MPDIRDELKRFLEEDVGYGDITTQAVVDPWEMGRGSIVAEERCILAGIDAVSELFSMLNLSVVQNLRDGEEAGKGDVVMDVYGRLAPMLTGERLALNLLMRMSGIATETAKIVKKAREINPNVRIAATRKTTPGFRYFEKNAVILGGGDSHRLRLDDGILIKENHIEATGGLEKAITLAKNTATFARKIEVEVTDLDMAARAAKAGADIIMLDNFSPEAAKKGYELVKSIDSRIIVEISGGINADNVASYAVSADVISIGALTHSVRSCNLSMDIFRENAEKAMNR